ncbi:ATP-binding cassette domain-containing protein [Palleronia abyssalis]|uniref:Fe(3+) ions import ATP-binding protein FbpC n=1 Tax=Palleronia abyssalis TaxID=1501240 RepID=A0A2R8BWU9_9RHOB|nr:ATP-binding cassette domain-containing protein [Palleronia abyssalis]SPJ24630.1 Fe(3+) ions import ATP-binding protein FbpC [Palleronia abyssalis]
MSEGLVLSNVTIKLAGTEIVAVNRRIGPGEVLTVMGPSGSGKSTLLSYLVGTLPRAFEGAGGIELNGRKLNGLPTNRRRIGILFQDDLLFPHLSVAGNLGFGVPPGPRKDRRQTIEAALDEVGLTGFGPRDPATLSGGQKARVALMRTLLARPEALLLDEPFSRLDADRRTRTRDLVFSITRARALPVLLVTHDAEDAAAAGGEPFLLGG